MTPGGWCYFDHSQTKNEDSVTIGSYLPLEKVYGYDPVPKELNEEEAKYILGAQGNVWTEYMAYPSKIEYMIFPRMSALSEVLWTPKWKKKWRSFELRLPQQLKRYELWKANYSKAYYDLQTIIEPTENNEGVKVSLTSKSKSPIAFRLIEFLENENGWSAYPPIDKKNVYTKSLLITKNSAILSVQDISNVIRTSSNLFLNINKATGKKITSNKQPSPNYPGNGGLFSLVNGAKSIKGINSSEWCGLVAQNVELIIDLGKETSIQEINLHILHQQASWIYAPEKFEIELSNDGINFEDPHTSFLDFDKYADENPMKWMKRKLSENPSKKYNTRYVKIKVSSVSKIPDGNPGAGKSAWMFIDEIEIN
jgi:hexosaminidase